MLKCPSCRTSLTPVHLADEKSNSFICSCGYGCEPDAFDNLKASIVLPSVPHIGYSEALEKAEQFFKEHPDDLVCYKNKVYNTFHGVSSKDSHSAYMEAQSLKKQGFLVFLRSEGVLVPF